MLVKGAPGFNGHTYRNNRLALRPNDLPITEIEMSSFWWHLVTGCTKICQNDSDEIFIKMTAFPFQWIAETERQLTLPGGVKDWNFDFNIKIVFSGMGFRSNLYNGYSSSYWNGLSPVWYQVIAWTNTFLLSIRLLRTDFSQIRFGIQNSHSRKCLWKCRLQNTWHSVQASISLC